MALTDPGTERAPTFSEGLYDRANAQLITEKHCSEVSNFNFDTGSAEEAFGFRRLNAARPKAGAVRLKPLSKRTSVEQMTRWRDGYLFAPLTKRLETEPQCIEVHFRLEESVVWPESGPTQVTRIFGGVTGRYTGTIGSQRAGGEHQFVPLVSRGAREVERPHFTLGIGVVRPQGLKTAGLADDSSADEINPIFAWWDTTEQRMRVAAADFALAAGVDYHVAIDCGSGSSSFYVNGAAVTAVTGHGLSALPLSSNAVFAAPSLLPIYFGRCYTREPGIKYDAQHDRKHAYMGKLACTVTAVGATTIRFSGAQLAFAAGTVSSYVGYRIRTITGATSGQVLVITATANPTVDTGAGSITFTVPAGHAIIAGNIVDIIPAIEPISAEVTIHDFRFWAAAQGATQIGRMAKLKLFSDQRAATFEKKPLLSPDWGASDATEIVAYWPLDDDGGTIARDLVGRSDAFFAPSALAVQDRSGASAGPRTLFLDGETQGVQVDFSEDPNFRQNWPWNFGRLSVSENEWNFCARMQLYVSGQMEATAAGNLQDHLFQTLFSIGNPETGSTVLEARITNFGANGLHVYFALPDGTYQAVPFTLTPGRFYNAIVGIEAPGEAVGDPLRHYVYFQFLDADLAPGGAFSAAITLKRVALDTGTNFVLTFGASTRGIATQGCGANNHALIGMSCLGIGHHPAHRLGAGAPTGTLAELVPLIRFSEIKERSDCVVPITGQDGGGTLVSGSRDITIATQDALPSYLRRFPLEVEHVDLTIMEKGELDRHVPNAQVIKTVSGTTITLMDAHQGYGVAGAELKAQVWAAYTNFETHEPAFDTDLNAGREASQQWAISKKVFKNLVGGALRIDVVIDPMYEFVSPLRVIPEWGPGVVTRLDAAIRSMKQFKGDTRAGLMAVSAGSLFEVDNRWRRDSPWRKDGFAFEFRVKPSTVARSLTTRREAASLLVTEERAYRNEALQVVGLAISGSNGYEVLEADVLLFSLDGRQTISGRGQQEILSVGGVRRLGWKKNHHWYVSNGDLVFEIVNEATAVYVRAKTAGNPILRANEWTRVLVEILWTAGILTSVTFRVDGKAVASATIQSGGFGGADIPALTDGTLGAIGKADQTAFVDVLNGRICGFAYRNSHVSTWPNFGADYQPTEILRTDYLGFAAGFGARITEAETALFLGDECVPIGHGMGPPTSDAPTDQEVSMSVFGGALYVNTGFTRPWRWDFVEFTAAGLREPAGRLRAVTVTRIPMRTKDAGADLPAAVGRASRADLNAASPNLRTFVPAAPTPAEADKGALVYVPHDPQMGAAGDFPCGYIGIVQDILATPGYLLNPPPATEQLVAGAGELAWTLFRTRAAVALGASAYKAAIMLLKSTTPWGARRLLCDGKNNNSAPQTEALAEGPTNDSCFHFRGNVYLESTPFRSAAMPVGRDKVLSVKGYLKVDSTTAFGDQQVVWEMGMDGDSGIRIVLFDGGRLRFEFYDTLLGAFRSIQTTGKVVSRDQWYYLHFRYRFKQKSSTALDATGGWEADLRWLRKGAGTFQLQKLQDFRDQLLIYACEGLHQMNPAAVGGYNHADAAAGYYGDVDEAAPCLLLTVPGCESTVGAATAEGAQSLHNHSQHLLNCGLLKSAPYLTPEPGDSLFPAAGVNASSPRSGIVLTLVSNIVSPLQVAGVARVGSSVGGAAAGGELPQFSLPAGFALPRSCSMNRDDAWTREANVGLASASQITQKVAGTTRNFWNSVHVPATTLVAQTPNLASFALIGGSTSYGKQECWAVLVRVWTMVATGGGAGGVGAFPDGASAGVPRVFALVHLDASDIGVSAVGGISGHQVFVTDDALYGGDGLGSLKIGGVAAAATSTWHATIELPNGLNQAASSPNRNVCPSLLEHGDNPVGVNDSPDPSLAPMRFGGTRNQGEDGVVRSGLKGYLDDVGVLIAALVHSGTTIYTADCLAPDAFFTGPKDTRFQSLPRLAFATNAAIIDDPSGAAATLATAVYRFDELSGGTAGKDGAFSTPEAPSLYLVKAEQSLQVEGEHRLRVTFHDPRQDVESKPNDEYLVTIEGKDGAGDFLDAESLFTLEGLPISGDRRAHLSRRIYKTLPGGGLPLLLAQVNDASTSGLTPMQNDVVLAQQRTLSFDNGRPPRCRAIFPTEENMAFVGIDDAPNVLAISKAFKPEHVPGTKIQYGESGRGGGLVAANFINTILVVAKRNAIFIVTPSGSAFRMQRIGQSVGVLAHNGATDVDGTLYFPAQKGIYTFAGNQRTYEATEMVERLYLYGLDIRALAHSFGAAYLDRGQYLLLVTLAGDEEHRVVLAGEQRFNQFGDRYYVWTRIEPGVGLSALCEYEDEDNQSGKIAIGSALGIIGQYDKDDTVFKEFTGTIHASSSTTGKLVLNPASSPDALKESMEGLPVLVVDETDEQGNVVATGGVDFVVRAQSEVAMARSIGATVATLLTRDPVNWFALVGKTALIGSRTWAIRSKWFSLERPETVSRYDFLDLYFDPIEKGPLTPIFVELYVDYEDVPNAHFRVELDQGFFSLPIVGQYFRALQFRIKGYGPRVGFVLHRYSLRGQPQQYAERQKS